MMMQYVELRMLRDTGLTARDIRGEKGTVSGVKTRERDNVIASVRRVCPDWLLSDPEPVEERYSETYETRGVSRDDMAMWMNLQVEEEKYEEEVRERKQKRRERKNS